MSDYDADWDDLPLHEKMKVFPDRHPVPLKYLIWLFMGLANFDSRLLKLIAERMGYERAPEVGVDLGGGMVLSPGVTYVVRPEMVIE